MENEESFEGNPGSFKQVKANVDVKGGGDSIWRQVPPFAMPWSTIPSNQLPPVVKFTGDTDVNDTFPFPQPFFHKRKTNDVDLKSHKKLLTEEIITERFKQMSINHDDKVSENNAAVNEIKGDLPTLTICPEIRDIVMPTLEPELSLPRNVWDDVEKRISKALVVWKPPTSILERRLTARTRHSRNKNAKSTGPQDEAMEG